MSPNPNGQSQSRENGNSYLGSNAPKPATERRPRQSLEGETIFAVGEDGDKWSDDDESPRNSHERKGLTG